MSNNNLTIILNSKDYRCDEDGGKGYDWLKLTMDVKIKACYYKNTQTKTI